MKILRETKLNDAYFCDFEVNEKKGAFFSSNDKVTFEFDNNKLELNKSADSNELIDPVKVLLFIIKTVEDLIPRKIGETKS